MLDDVGRRGRGGGEVTKIEWADKTRNPVKGCWGPGGSPERPRWCDYCFAKAWAGRKMTEKYRDGFEPAFFPELLDESEYRVGKMFQSKNPNLPLGSAMFFMVDMGDLFGDWVEKEIIESVVRSLDRHPEHKYLFLTKNPKRYREIAFKPNHWLGTTIEGWSPSESRQRMYDLTRGPKTEVKFVSFEPLLGNVAGELLDAAWDSWFDDLDWVIIGKMTGRSAKLQKYKYVVNHFDTYATNLVEASRMRNIPVFVKGNSGWPDPPREWPR
jgi:protein gp37